ncbi:MAG: zinc ribbon domain-containing protein [Pseudomonadota bacterium]
MTFLVAGLVALGVVALVAYPFWTRDRLVRLADDERPSLRLAEFRAGKDSSAQALRELEFDFDTEKLSEEDYDLMRAKHRALAIQAMKELEPLEAAWKLVQDELDARLNQALGVSSSQEFPSIPGLNCPACGTGFLPSDRFCSQCGHAREKDAHERA